MAQTYSNILLHIVFSTKNRDPVIDQELRPRLYEYIGGIVRGEKGMLHEIGGTDDHVHMLLRWRTDEAVATLLRNLKSHSSGWIHKTMPKQSGFWWQAGYGVFSVSQSQLRKVKAYIQGQEEHHRHRAFKEEFVALLKAHSIDYDERYIWD